MANISDHVSMYNIAPFGRCRTTAYPPTGSATAANKGVLTPMPCVPGTMTEWINGKSDYLVKGKPALLKSSYCRCQWGGIITITDDGQRDTGDANLNKVALQSEEELLEEEHNENATLDINAVLDGIQTVLDFAGFAPGVGSIPDLLNAAISACRGNWAESGLSLIAAVPGIGDAAAGVKLASRGLKLSKRKEKLSKMAKRCVGKDVDISVTKLMSKGMTEDEAIFFRRSVRNERREFARKFYEDSGCVKSTEIDTHLCGIDFNKPVKVKTTPPPEVFYQYQRRGTNTLKRTRGSYYTPDKNAQPTELGIYDRFAFKEGRRENKKYHVEIHDVKPQKALISTAAPIKDNWSIPGKSYQTKGGGIQYFMPIQ